MDSHNQFGGNWTVDKLQRLSGYLHAYMRIFEARPWATTVYIDAFAGSGSIVTKRSGVPPTNTVLLEEGEIAQFVDGSARVALAVDPPFHRYLFVEKSASKAKQLESVKDEFQQLAPRIEIVQADANDYLTRWIKTTNWQSTRSVVFLDPCGMQVEWRLIEAIAGTRAIDLWLLVPIGMGVNRIMTQSGLPPQGWQDRLTAFFGSNEWISRFYRPAQQPDLFGDGPGQERSANYEALADYFVGRLKAVFGEDGVAPNPLTQRNSRNSPMFLLCFASANKNGVKIADWLLTNKPKRKAT